MQPLHPFALARYMLPIGLAGLGLVTIAYGDFALQWQPIPKELPAHTLIAYVSAALLLTCAVGLCLRRFAPDATLLLVGYLALFWVMPHLPEVWSAPSSVAAWLGLCEPLGALSGAAVLWSVLRQARLPESGVAPSVLRLARCGFGLCCIVYGVSHFAYADFTAAMIPGWIPGHQFLAYLTGAGHLLAGVSITLLLFARLAAPLEALMMSLFVFVLHVPSLWAVPAPMWAPTLRIEITALFWAMSLAGCAWAVAESLIGGDAAAATAPQPLPPSVPQHP
jgi:uncharacterized membrane protein YphA (DoxX/SURF4 family)